MTSGRSDGTDSGAIDTGAARASALRRDAEAARVGGEVRFENGAPARLGDKGRRTRSAILRAAGVVFVREGWAGTTMAAIAAEADIAVGTAYQYFRSREELFATLVRTWTIAALDQLRSWDPADGAAGLRVLIGSFVRAYAATAPIQRVWDQASVAEPELAALRRELIDVYVHHFGEAFDRGAALGVLDPLDDALATARALCAMVDGYCQQAFSAGDHVDRDEGAATELLTSLWVSALSLRG